MNAVSSTRHSHPPATTSQGFRPAEPCSLSAVAMHHLLTNLLIFLMGFLAYFEVKDLRLWVGLRLRLQCLTPRPTLATDLNLSSTARLQEKTTPPSAAPTSISTR